MIAFIEKIVGCNWRTTLSQIGVALSSALTLLAALPYQLGEVATIIPPAYKTKVVVVGLIASFVLRVINGTQQQDKNNT